jgi:hypothetical protein
MSGKNRAFALAVATAALVGFAAPAASASSNPSGFNNDSILNVSNNLVPLQACNNNIPVNAGFLAGQLGLSDISALLGLVNNTGSSTTNDNRNCTLTPSQDNTSTTDTNSTSGDPSGGNNSGWNNSGGNNSGGNDPCGCGNTGSKGSDHGAANESGFNNDSILNLSNNEVPIQACNNDIPVNAGVGVIQAVGEDLSAVGGLFGNSGSSTVNDNRNCTMMPSQGNTSTTDTNSSSS